MFFRAFLIGGAVGLVGSFIASWRLVLEYISPFDAFELLGLFLVFLGYALTFAAVSLAGFLAYIFIQNFGEGMLRAFWPTVQVGLIAFALFDIVYFSNKGIDLKYRILIMLIVLLSAIIVSYVKVQQTNRRAIIPAHFFMVVVTGLELTLVLRTDELTIIFPMMLTLIVTNAYQLITWYHVTKEDPEHTKRIERRRKEREQERQKALQKLQAEQEEKAAKSKSRKKKRKKK